MEQEAVRVNIIISHQIDIKLQLITKDEWEHFILIKGRVKEEDITTLNIYSAYTGTLVSFLNGALDLKIQISTKPWIRVDSNSQISLIKGIQE